MRSCSMGDVPGIRPMGAKMRRILDPVYTEGLLAPCVPSLRHLCRLQPHACRDGLSFQEVSRNVFPGLLGL